MGVDLEIRLQTLEALFKERAENEQRASELKGLWREYSKVWDRAAEQGHEIHDIKAQIEQLRKYSDKSFSIDYSVDHIGAYSIRDCATILAPKREVEELRTENETNSSQSRYIREHIKKCNTEIELLYRQRDNHISVLRHINASSNSKDKCSE